MPLPPTELAILSGLLEQALELPADERVGWIESLPEAHAGLKPWLRQLLASAAAPETSDWLHTLPKLDRGPRPCGEEHAPGERIGPYELIRPLGQGGMGAVWLAQRADGALQRQVALKLPLLSAHPLTRQRLARERDILAGLEHANIARLYDAGVDDSGQPYLALEHVEGEWIDAYCRAHACDTRTRLKLFLQVARAVAFAHAHLVLHRDLKPSNILVSGDGQVRLLDFGIAKLLQDGGAQDSELTQQAGRALTPDYASPEQIVGQGLTVASDVYGLGVVLYELLALARPYRLKRDSRGALEDAILTAEPRPPSAMVEARALRRQLVGDLDTIVLKALKKSPADRYATVNAFAEDIERHLAGLPVLAQADTAWYRARKFLLRNRLAVGAVAGVLASLLAGTMLALWQASAARLEARKAQAVQAFLTDVFLANTHDQPDPRKAQNTTARELLAIGARKIESALQDAPEARVEVLRTVAGLLSELGLDDEAVKLQRNRVALLRALHGSNDARVAAALLDLSGAMESSASTAGRAEVLAQVQAIVDSGIRADPAMRAELHFQFASQLQYRDWPASARHARQAAELFRAQGAVARLMEASALEADAADEMGDPEAAERGYGESLRIARSLRQGSPRLLPMVQMRLASVQGTRLNLVDADRNFREAIDAAERIYGRDHDIFVETIVTYGAFLAQNSRIKDALSFLRQAAEIHQRIKGVNETYQLPKTLSLLGIVLVEYGLPEEGATLLERAVQLKRDAKSDNLSLAAYLHLAWRGQAETGHLAQAAAMLDEAAQIIARQDPQAVQSLLTLNRVERARLSLLADKPHDALDLLQSAGVVVDDRPVNRVRLGSRLVVAEAQVLSGSIDEAERTSRQARAAIEQLGLGPSAARESARLDMIDGRVLMSRADAEAATAILRRALATRRALLDPQSPLLAQTQVELARARRLAGDTGEAAQLLREARAVAAAHPALAPRFTQLR